MTIEYDPAMTYTDDEWQVLLSVPAPVPRAIRIVREGGDDWQANWTAGTLTHAGLTKMCEGERIAFVAFLHDKVETMKLKVIAQMIGLDVPTLSKIKNGRYVWR